MTIHGPLQKEYTSREGYQLWHIKKEETTPDCPAVMLHVLGTPPPSQACCQQHSARNWTTSDNKRTSAKPLHHRCTLIMELQQQDRTRYSTTFKTLINNVICVYCDCSLQTILQHPTDSFGPCHLLLSSKCWDNVECSPSVLLWLYVIIIYGCVTLAE